MPQGGLLLFPLVQCEFLLLNMVQLSLCVFVWAQRITGKMITCKHKECMVTVGDGQEGHGSCKKKVVVPAGDAHIISLF